MATRKKNSPAARAFKKVKSKSLSSLKKKADAVFSLYIRQRGSAGGMNTCYTCGKRAEWKSLQCGHFIARHHSATRFDPQNCRPQCVGCNVWGRGQAGIFADNLLKELGTKRFKDLLARGRKTHQFTRGELEQIIQTYTT